MIMNILSLVTFPFWFVFYTLWFGAGSVHFNVNLTIVLLAISVFVHEAIHILAIRVITPHTKVALGFKKPFTPYVIIHAGDMPTAPRLAFLMAPLVMISAIMWVCAGIWHEQSFVFIITAASNASGSINDLYRVWTLIKYPMSDARLPWAK